MSKKLKEDKSYIKDLLHHLKIVQDKGGTKTFKIVEPRGNGFLVKVGGLFAYLPFHYMPWEYRILEHWHQVSNKLVGNIFTCNIHKIEEQPIGIQINAKDHRFKQVNLEKSTSYQAIIIEKVKYGLFVDLGCHFNWEFGSIYGLVHKNSLSDQSIYHNAKEGEDLSITFQGYNNEGQIVLGDNQENVKWILEAAAKYIGTVQNAKVRIDEEGYRKFYILNQYESRIPTTKIYYSESDKEKAKEIISNLKDGETVKCEVMKINKKKDSFILKLLF